jgi:transposase
VDQGNTGGQAVYAAATEKTKLEVVKLPEAKKGFLLLPKRWVVESNLAWSARFRRLLRDDERLRETLAGLQFLAFVIIMLKRFVMFLVQST